MVMKVVDSSPKCPIDKEEIHKYFLSEAVGLSSKKLNMAPPPWEQEMLQPEAPSIEDHRGLEICSEEVRSTLSQCEKKGAPGWDGITYGSLSSLPSLVEWLAKIYERCRTMAKIPSAWKFGHTKLFFKNKGDKLDCKNWRPICLSSCCYKLYTVLISRRLVSYDRQLQRRTNGNSRIFSVEQRGFMPGIEGTRFNTLALKEIIESIESKAHRVKDSRVLKSKDSFDRLALGWIDFRNAFGSVDRNLIKYAMKWLQLPKYFQEIIGDLYEASSMQIETLDGWTEPIVLERGVKQGCPLSPLIFNMCVELLLRWMNAHSSVSILGEKIAVLAYADDLVFIHRNGEHLRAAFRRLEIFSKWANIKIHPKKSMVLVLDENRTISDPSILINSERIPCNKSYKNLGTILDPSKFKFDELKKDLDAELNKMMVALTRSPLKNFMKIQLFKMFVFPKLSFPLTMASLSKGWLEKKDIYVRRCMRKWLGLPPGSNNDWFYTPNSKGGLQIPSFANEYSCSSASSYLKGFLAAFDPQIMACAHQSFASASWEIFDKLSSNKYQALPVVIQDFRKDLDNINSRPNPVRWLQAFDCLGDQDKQTLLQNNRVRIWFDIMANIVQLQWSFTPSTYNNRESFVLSEWTIDGFKPIKKKVFFKSFNALKREAHHKSWLEHPHQGVYCKKALDEEVIPSSYHWLQHPHLIGDKVFSWNIKCILGLIPCGTNLVQWKKSTSPLCQLCLRDKKEQHRETVGHVLGGCGMRLNIYSKRHDAGLFLLADKCCENKMDISVDNAIRPDVCNVSSNLRPDLVKYSLGENTVNLVDMKAPFHGSNFAKVNNDNLDKYSSIQKQIQEKGWTATLQTCIISCTGLIPKTSVDAVMSLGFNSKMAKSLLREMSIQVIKGSYKLYSTLGQRH